VKEIRQLMYVPPVWMEGDEPKEDDNEDEEEELEEDETSKENPPGPLEKSHFIGFTFYPDTKHSEKVGPLNPE
jgi:hypothetical protein